MSTITLHLVNLEGVRYALKNVGKTAEEVCQRAVLQTALEVQTDVKRMIQSGPKTGRVYRRGKGKNLSATHQASAPGQPPATDSGTLVSSIYFEQENPLVATIGSRLAYAAYLEFGTRRMRARPSWTPAVTKAMPKLKERVVAAVAEALK